MKKQILHWTTLKCIVYTQFKEKFRVKSGLVIDPIAYSLQYKFLASFPLKS